MNFFGIRDLSNNTKKVMMNVASNKKAVITDNGKPSALLLSINEDTFETVLSFVQRLEAQLALEEIQRQSAANFPNGISEEEIQAEIDAVRRGE